MSLHLLGCSTVVGINWTKTFEHMAEAVAPLAANVVAPGSGGLVASAMPGSGGNKAPSAAPAPAPIPQAPPAKISKARLALYIGGGAAGLGLVGAIIYKLVK